MYDYYGFRPYVPVAKKLANARAYAKKKLGKKSPHPIEIAGLKISKTFWGDAWCKNLETYSDYENRMPRGRTYVRNGSVVHLEIEKGVVKSFVAGSDTYECQVKIDPLDPKRWQAIKQKCSGEIGSVVELLQGKLSKHVLAIITDKKEGLFPAPKEIHLDCSCPDWATMCKHVAATLYGVGALLDTQPELFFLLRGVDYLELIDTTVEISGPTADAETLDSENLEDIFGVELSDSLAETKKEKPKRKKAVVKTVKTVKTPKKGTKTVKTVKTPKKSAKTVKTVKTPKKGTKTVKTVKTPKKSTKTVKTAKTSKKSTKKTRTT